MRPIEENRERKIELQPARDAECGDRIGVARCRAFPPPLKSHGVNAFRPDIEGLRALAILLVIFSHAGLPIFPSGFIGVNVFFVLSGYLITRLLLQEIPVYRSS